MPVNDRLFELLRGCSSGELSLVWVDDLDKKLDSLRALSSDKQVDAVSAEIRSAAGHTLGNLRRGDHDLAWRHVLTGVYDTLANGVKTAPHIDHDTDVKHLEQQVLRAADLRVKAAWDRLSDEQRKSLVDEISASADFEQDAIHGPRPLWQRIAEVGATGATSYAVGAVIGGAGLFASPLLAVGAPVLVARQASKLMGASFRRLVPAILHLLHYNGVRSLPV